MSFAPRPIELKVAIACAFAWLLVNLAATAVGRDQLGEGWFVVWFIQFFVAAIYVVFLIFAYNGRGWVRYFMLVVFLYVFGSVASMGVRLLLEPVSLIMFVLWLSAIAFWFSPNANNWYRIPRQATTNNGNE